VVITADALHTQRGHVEYLHARRALGVHGQGQSAPATPPARRAALAGGRDRPP
jgi:hypothetical protein